MRGPARLLLGAGVALLAARRLRARPYDLSGKVVLITGGSRGLGLALARELTGRGARVALLARDAAELDRAVQDVRARGGQAIRVVADVTDAASLERAVQATVAHYGQLDVVVSNAGIIQAGPLTDMTEADFEHIMQVNGFAALRVTRAALPHLKRARGRVLIVSSVAAKAAIPHLGPYSVSKFASYGLGQALRAELAPQGVTVTTVLPALMRTGSARRVTVKGEFEKEYAVFATLDNVPLLSLDAPRAARQIVGALVRGDSEAMIGGPAHLLRWASALAPGLTADVMALVTRTLPDPTGRPDARRGAQAETPLTRGNPIKQAAERDLNQL